MPANEQTWRSPRMMHLTFAVSSLAMLFATLWMFYADYTRGWKVFAKKAQDIDNWFLQSRITERRTDEYVARQQELARQLQTVQQQPLSSDLLNSFQAELKNAGSEAAAARIDRVAQSHGGGEAGGEAAADQRAAIVETLQSIIGEARFQEESLATARKFERANLDVARSDFELGVGNQLPESELSRLQGALDQVTARVNELTEKYQTALTHRQRLDAIYADMTAEQTRAQKALDDFQSDVAGLEKTLDSNTALLRGTLTLPILDAFNSPLKIEQIWTPTLTLNNNFKDVARFDRCTTCHRGIDKSQPGQPSVAGLPQQEQLSIVLPAPAEAPPSDATLASVYGMTLSGAGLVNPGDVMVQAVVPLQPAAKAGLAAADVIEFIGDSKITSAEVAERMLLRSVKPGQALTLKIRRGFPQPFASHPRLDLFVGSLSPHPKEKFGCTICHQGQGSATAFEWASHTPNTLTEREDWAHNREWFDNHHWIYPMYPERFAESGCLKCHHEVVDLQASARFPEPPAPKLMAGYDLLRRHGCYGCHEINGWATPVKRNGPDLRVEPNFTFAAQQLLTDPGLPEEYQELARTLIDDPEIEEPRHRLSTFVESDMRRRQTNDSEQPPVLNANSYRMLSVLADVENPGRMRKPGPSLRYSGSKMDRDFLFDWIANPQNFRPTTRMPRFFGLYDHLTAATHGKEGSGESKTLGLQVAERFEPLEVRSTVEYLLSMSQPFAYAAPPEGISGEPSAERGRTAFQLRGCLACHSHREFPQGKADQGPDLSRIGGKLSHAAAEKPLYGWSEQGPQWLYSWVREPNRYHARTVMPDLYLQPVEVDGDLTDPAADITAWLLQSNEWKPADLPEYDAQTLRELAQTHLKDKFTLEQASRFAQEGIPSRMAGQIIGDEALLVGDFSTEELPARLMLYVGKRTIGKYGCAGCHDIPGFEDAKPIGTGLNNWARKDIAQLAFEQIAAYVTSHGPLAAGAHGHDSSNGGHDSESHSAHAAPDFEKLPPDDAFFTHALLNHQREGFLWQKIREPRSYDYQKTENKGYNERLRMPRFNLSATEREELMTFILGLVAEPPADQYIHRPAGARGAIIEGLPVLEKFNCAGCHEMETEQWEFQYDPGAPDMDSERSFPEDEYAFFNPHFTPQQLAASRRIDRRGMGRAVITGRVVVDEEGTPQEAPDDEERPVRYYTLWKPAAINGQTWLALDQVPILNANLLDHRPPVGGEFARLVHPIALAIEREKVPATKYENAWGFVPPPLVHEGQKVQTEWLHNFLMDPHPIRPAAVLRMPNFHMSSSDARKLVNYFAAKDGAEYPYEYDGRTREGYLARTEAATPGRLEDAVTIITNNNYCVKCHLVGDYSPPGSNAAKAPNLANVHARLRPEWTLHWVGNPLRILPYTGMPINFPPNKPVDPKALGGKGGDLVHQGTARQQLQAVVDLLQNFDRYAKEKNQLTIAPPAASGGGNPGEAGAGEETSGGSKDNNEPSESNDTNQNDPNEDDPNKDG